MTSRRAWTNQPSNLRQPNTQAEHDQHHSFENTRKDTRFRPTFDSHSRAGSVYTLSRVSFSSQIAQLTSIQLPQASSLAKAVSSIPTASGALHALKDAAYQIQRWIRKASEVVDGLDAGGELEWAVAAGRQGISKVNLSIEHFEVLINTYVSSVEKMQLRSDADLLSAKDLNNTLDNIEAIASSWQGIKTSLEQVKCQVELSMEWEELQSTVFGQIEAELRNLSKIVFEMEERRHQRCDNSVRGANVTTTSTPQRPDKRCELSSGPSTSPTTQYYFRDTQDESLLALFARMRPLRAALDLLPMRLAGFRSRAFSIFPVACEELERQMQALEHAWTRVESDSDSLKKELGEDKWVNVFQNAAMQAIQMIESVRKSIAKVDESLDSDTRSEHAPSTQRRIANYETKKAHYCPAIVQIISITSQGMSERTTVNGEITRLQTNVQQRWSGLQMEVKDLDTTLHSYSNGIRFRDSISSLPSTSCSRTSSPTLTPRSSPPSSVTALSTKSSYQHLQGSARSNPSITNTPSSLRTRRSCAALVVKSSPSSRSLRPNSPLSAYGRRSDAMALPIRTKQPKLPLINTEKPRWNSSTRIDNGGGKKPTLVWTTESSPIHTSMASSKIWASSATTGLPGTPGPSPSSSLVPRGRLRSKQSLANIKPSPSASSGTPVKVLRVQPSAENLFATVTGCQNSRVLRTKPSQGLLPARNAPPVEKSSRPLTALRNPPGHYIPLKNT